MILQNYPILIPVDYGDGEISEQGIKTITGVVILFNVIFFIYLCITLFLWIKNKRKYAFDYYFLNVFDDLNETVSVVFVIASWSAMGIDVLILIGYIGKLIGGLL